MNRIISFIIPAYNEGNYICGTINSIKESINNKFDYEIIVIDNGSLDNTVSVVARLKATVFVKPELTVAGLRNFGAKMAKGDILVFLDADIVLTEEWAKNFYLAEEKVRENPYVITGSRCDISSENTWIERSWFKPLNSEALDHMNSGHLITTRKLFEDLGGFSDELVADEDPDLGIRAKYLGAKIINISELKVIHQRYPKSIKQFFNREIWHGKGQYQEGITNSRTGIVTIMFLILHIFLILSLCVKEYTACILFIILIAMICLLSSKLKYKKPLIRLLKNAYLYYFYFLARAVSFINCAFSPKTIERKRKSI